MSHELFLKLKLNGVKLSYACTMDTEEILDCFSALCGRKKKRKGRENGRGEEERDMYAVFVLNPLIRS